MYHFLQFRADKKEAWRLFDTKQLPDLEKKPAFITVLAIDQDPEHLAGAGEDPIDHVKYLGPMYWDFDGDDLDEVLDDTRELLIWLEKNLDIPEEYIHCWLSGQKGVHVTVPSEVFGIRTPQKILPMVYKEIALSLDLKTLDRSVYSCGRGRMWRCEGVPRPVTNTYKVGVTPAELQEMDSEQYAVLVASPRPLLQKDTPEKSLIFPKAQSLLKVCRSSAQKKFRAMQAETTMPLDALKALDGIPGCIEKLITEGDCVESNWNQAAMQLASYIAARYTREDADEYTQQLIEPFVQNVESSSRPTVAERRKHVKEQLNRTFSGRIKFNMGPLIATLGQPCGSCPLCRADLAAGLDEDSNADSSYCDITKVRFTPAGMFMVGENSMRHLTTFTFRAHTEVKKAEFKSDRIEETTRESFVGTFIDDTGAVIEDFEMPDRAWLSRRDLLAAVAGRGSATVHCSDADIQKAFRAVMTISGNDMKKVTKTGVCGLIFERVNRNIIPHYVEAGGSYTQAEVQSRFLYDGERGISPDLLDEEYPFEDDTELEETLRNLFKINDPWAVAATIGWVVSCHFREHIQSEMNQFPLLNLNGGAGAGKSSFAFLAVLLGGIDYSEVDFVNVETSTIYPLIRFVTSSTTVPRLVEEVNPSIMQHKDYNKVLGIFKASWNRAPIPRGYITGGKDLKVNGDRVSAPIIYTSEQPPSVPSLRSRSLEVRLAVKSLHNPDYVKAYKAANKTRHSMRRMAKALVTKAINTTPADVTQMYEDCEALVPEKIGQRPKFAFQTALVGLEMLKQCCETYGVDVTDEVQELSDSLTGYLTKAVREMATEKSVSEVDKVLQALDSMAGEPDDVNSGLRAGTHYWRKGNDLYLILQAIMPRYLRFARSTGDSIAIRDHMALGSLLQGETYFKHTDQHPEKPALRVHVIDMGALSDKGTVLVNFIDESEP